MDWQQIITLTIVSVTAFLLIRYEIRKRRMKKHGCGPACSCEPPAGIARNEKNSGEITTIG